MTTITQDEDDEDESIEEYKRRIKGSTGNEQSIIQHDDNGDCQTGATLHCDRMERPVTVRPKVSMATERYDSMHKHMDDIEPKLEASDDLLVSQLLEPFVPGGGA
jgi:hypothetical protein